MAAGGTLELIATAEGVLLERRRHAEVRIASDGAPLIVFEDAKPLSNEESIEVIHHYRDQE